MARYILWRLVWSAILLAFIFTLVFFVSSMTMLRYWGRPPYDLHQEFSFTVTRFMDYVHNIITEWNWGTRAGTYPEPVWDYAWRHMVVTVRLNMLALGIYLPVSIILGTFSALKQNSLFDKTVNTFVMLFGSIPHFILMYLLIIALAIRNRWLPYNFPGFETPDTSRMILGLVIPMIALCMPAILRLSRLVRGEFIESQHDDYLLLCKTKGLTGGQALRRHAFRNSVVPIMPELTPTFLLVLGGSFFVEMIYGVNGAARLMFHSVLTSCPSGGWCPQINIPMTMAMTMFYASFGLGFALLVDLIYPIVDPRIKIGAKPTDT